LDCPPALRWQLLAVTARVLELAELVAAGDVDAGVAAEVGALAAVAAVPTGR
jgi:hypothetical protein